MELDLSALARGRTAPDAWLAWRARILEAPRFDDAWPLLRDVLTLPGSKVAPEANALLGELLARTEPDRFLPLTLESAGRGPVPARLAAVAAIEAAAGRADADRLLDALAPFAGDPSEAVRERAATALGVLALHAPEAAGPRVARLAASANRREAQVAAGALWGLAARDLPAGLAALEGIAEQGDGAITRRALVQVGFAYRYRPFDAEERKLLWDTFARIATSPKGPGRKAILEVATPLAAFNERPEALADLDRFLATLGRTRAAESYARPAPRPKAPCSRCGELADYAVYFCPACGDVKPHNPLRLIEGLPVERGPSWPRPGQG